MKHPFTKEDVEAACEPFDPGQVRVQDMDEILQQAWDSAVKRGAVTVVPYSEFSSAPSGYALIKLPEEK